MTKCSTLTITLVTAFTLLCLTEGLLPIQFRCRCTSTASREIPAYRIVKLEEFQRGPQCKHVEVIATIRTANNKETLTCLNPKKQWVQNILKKWNESQLKSTEAAS